MNPNLLLEEDIDRICRSIPADVYQQLNHEADSNPVVLGGGFVRDTILGLQPNDLDLFCNEEIVARRIVNNLLVDRLGAADHLYETDHAITVMVPGHMKVQVIYGWKFATFFEAIARFDFTVCQAAIKLAARDGEWESICADRFYPDLAAKRLVYTAPEREELPAGSLLRVLKFVKRGYTIDSSSLAGVIARLNGVLGSAVGAEEEDDVSLLTTELRKANLEYL